MSNYHLENKNKRNSDQVHIPSHRFIDVNLSCEDICRLEYLVGKEQELLLKYALDTASITLKNYFLEWHDKLIPLRIHLKNQLQICNSQSPHQK